MNDEYCVSNETSLFGVTFQKYDQLINKVKGHVHFFMTNSEAIDKAMEIIDHYPIVLQSLAKCAEYKKEVIK